MALGGCGGGGHPHKATSAIQPAGQGFLTTRELSRELGNGFRSRLYRLAVMSQQGDEAPDLGQPLPTGTLREIHCRRPKTATAGTAAQIWGCTADWETADGRRTSTGYRVRVDDHECFFATAKPALAPHYDATARTYSEHPLNTVTSLKRGC